MRTKLIFLALVVAGISFRFLPHASNLVPITALGLLAAAYLPRRWALGVPLLTMVVSDLSIGLHNLVAFTWGSYVLITYLGSRLYDHSGKRSLLIGLGPVGAVIFFVITNFGVWLEGRLYEYSWTGLMRCYDMALPFFRATFLADTVYTPALFGLAALLAAAYQQRQTLKGFFSFHDRQGMV